jgi:hypothetical protein
MGGAVARVATGGTAFGHRDARSVLNIGAGWTDRKDDQIHVGWARDLWNAIRPETDGAYVNSLASDDDRRLGEAYDPATLSRLRAIKASRHPIAVMYDPTFIGRPDLQRLTTIDEGQGRRAIG